MEIKHIYVFPVKSLKGIEVQESPIDDYGFKHDRMYALASPGTDGKFTVITQRKVPALARIHTKMSGNSIVLSSNENGRHEEVKLPLDLANLPKDMPALNMELWGHDMVCSDVGAALPEVKEFIGRFFGEDSKYTGSTLIASKVRRRVPSAGPETDAFVKESGHSYHSSFQDLFPATIMATASFSELEERVELRGGDPIQNRSFRMNMVVDTGEPWAEDDWKRLRIGGHEWFVDSPCKRCTIPSVDQDLGATRPSKQPLPELNRFRILVKGKTPCFGLNLYHKDTGFSVRVGDEVEVIETSD